MRPAAILLAALLLLAATPSLAQAAHQPAQHTAPQEAPANRPRKPILPKARSLGARLELRRDPATGELRDPRADSAAAGATSGSAGAAPATIRARVNLVAVACNALLPDGSHLRGLGRDDFRLFEDGVEQTIAHFDASSQPASIALVLDASPSVFRELAEIKAAARSLAQELSPLDEVAVVAFAGQATLLLPFSRDRALLVRALASPTLARVENSPESNIYRAVYLTARELFRGRAGRKAILLLTDGQDSALGLSWDPSSAMPRALGAMPPVGVTPPVAGAKPRAPAQADSLTFEDVVRELAADGVEVYAISTQPRPRAMTDAWLAAHRDAMLITPAARDLGIPHYTLYLAELVRRAGARLYFLHEMPTLGHVYRRIAQALTAQYTLGYYPSHSLARSGWRSLRVELRASTDESAKPSEVSATGTARGATNHRDAHVLHRVAYYVPAIP